MTPTQCESTFFHPQVKLNSPVQPFRHLRSTSPCGLVSGDRPSKTLVDSLSAVGRCHRLLPPLASSLRNKAKIISSPCDTTTTTTTSSRSLLRPPAMASSDAPKPPSTSKLPEILSRRRQKPSGDEEATQTIRLGDFADDQTLSVSEARALLNTLIERRKDDPSIPPPPNTDVFVKTRKYMNQASRHKSQAAATQVAAISGRLLDGGVITMFERAQLSMSALAVW